MGRWYFFVLHSTTIPNDPSSVLVFGRPRSGWQTTILDFIIEVLSVLFARSTQLAVPDGEESA